MRARFTQWRHAVETQRVKHIVLARVWFVFGIVGVFTPLKESIPVLFFISVYANYASERATAQGYAVEARQEAAEAAAHGAD